MCRFIENVRGKSDSSNNVRTFSAVAALASKRRAVAAAQWQPEVGQERPGTGPDGGDRPPAIYYIIYFKLKVDPAAGRGRGRGSR